MALGFAASLGYAPAWNTPLHWPAPGKLSQIGCLTLVSKGVHCDVKVNLQSQIGTGHLKKMFCSDNP